MYEKVDQVKYDGKPVQEIQSLLSSYLLGDERSIPKNYMLLQKTAIVTNDEYIPLGKPSYTGFFFQVS